MGVELGRPQVRVAQHLLDAPQVGASFEEVGGEGVAQDLGVHAVRVEAGFLGQLAKDEERPRAGERPALGVEEELWAMPPVEIRPPTRLVTADGLRSLAAERDDAFLAALPGAADEPVVEVDAPPLESDRLAH